VRDPNSRYRISVLSILTKAHFAHTTPDPNLRIWVFLFKN